MTDDLSPSSTTRATFGCGNIYFVIDEKDGRPFRIYLKKGHTGVCHQALLEAIGRLASIMLQATDVPMERIVRTLRGITCDGGVIGKLSCMDVLARMLDERYVVKEEVTDDGTVR